MMPLCRNSDCAQEYELRQEFAHAGTIFSKKHKIAEHGGDSKDDTAVALLIADPTKPDATINKKLTYITQVGAENGSTDSSNPPPPPPPPRFRIESSQDESLPVLFLLHGSLTLANIACILCMFFLMIADLAGASSL